MIQLEQVRNLETKVKQAVEFISRLKSENDYLKGRLTTYEVRIQELENLINSFRNSQSEIEAGIINALEELDHIQSSGSSPESEAAVSVDFVAEPVPETAEAVSFEPGTNSSEDWKQESPTPPEESPTEYNNSDNSVSEAPEVPEPDSQEGDLFAQDSSDEYKEEEPSLGIF